MDRIEKSWKDLNFDEVDFDSGNWAWSCGGEPHKNFEFSICYVDEKLDEIRYKMPACISKMLMLQRKFGIDEAQNNIKHALGIHS